MRKQVLSPDVLQSVLQALSRQGLGKRTRSDLYAHRSLLDCRKTQLKAAGSSIDPGLLPGLNELWRAHTGAHTGNPTRTSPPLPPWNIVKISARGDAISLLCYPEFEDIGHPALAASLVLRLDPASGGAGPTEPAPARLSEYRDRANPPVMHRKELFVAPDYPHAQLFRALSAAEEAAGLLQNAHLVGHRLQWEQRLQAAGYRVDGHRLLRS